MRSRIPTVTNSGKPLMVVFLLVASTISADVGSTYHQHSRQTRGVGFFHKVTQLGSLLYQQYNDTTYTLKNVYDLLSNEFTDTFTTTTPDPRTSSTTPDPSTSTTPKYRVSRAELGRILNRNYRGLQKLFRLEWNDAWNQTKYNIEEYKRELKNSAFPPKNKTVGPVNVNLSVEAKVNLDKP